MKSAMFTANFDAEITEFSQTNFTTLRSISLNSGLIHAIVRFGLLWPRCGGVFGGPAKYVFLRR